MNFVFLTDRRGRLDLAARHGSYCDRLGFGPGAWRDPMWWISIWLLVSAAFVGWAVRARLTIGQGEALAQHIRNARQLLLAVDECVLLPSVAAQRVSGAR